MLPSRAAKALALPMRISGDLLPRFIWRAKDPKSIIEASIAPSRRRFTSLRASGGAKREEEEEGLKEEEEGWRRKGEKGRKRRVGREGGRGNGRTHSLCQGYTHAHQIKLTRCDSVLTHDVSVTSAGRE